MTSSLTARRWPGIEVSVLRRSVFSLRRYLCAIVAGALVAGCSDQAGPAPKQHISGPVPFRYSIVDREMNTGRECCTDVLAVGDLNNDGFADLVVGGQGAKEAGLVWYEYPLWKKHAVSDGEITTDGKVADIDGDGNADIIAGDISNGFSWFRNPGAADTGAWSRHVIDDGYVHDIEVADLDDDGDPDLVTSDKKRVIIWRQESPQKWVRAVEFEKKTEGIALADINGDGRTDVVLGGMWLEAPADTAGKWAPRVIAPHWTPDTRVAVADMNDDGRPDVVLTASEGAGVVSWFEQGADQGAEGWTEHPVTRESLEGAHSLQVADMDLDGDLDVVVAEMHTSPQKRVVIYLQTQDQWTPFVISDRGSHNLRVADLDADGDPDIIGKNYAGEGSRPLELWENLVSNAHADKALQALRSAKDTWAYLAIDAARPASQKGKMGLVSADINQDGKTDVIAGSLAYTNPGGKLRSWWPRVQLREDFDAFFSANVDDDRLADLIGFAGSEIVWLEASEPSGGAWQASTVGAAPAGRVQGYESAQVEEGDKPELLFTKGNHLAYLRIPDAGAIAKPWDMVVISTDVEEADISTGDIDGDGDLDVATVASDGHHAVWFENPSRPGAAWPQHPIGTSALWLDRLSLADINGDGRLDLVASEESRRGHYSARLYWYDAPRDPKKEAWSRNTILTLRSINSMSVSDLNADGLPDIVVAEHTDLRNGEWAPDNVTAVLYNRSAGSGWELAKVEVGQHSSHLGGHLVDLDGDGIQEIVSIGWEQYCCVHVWTEKAFGETSEASTLDVTEH